MGFKTECFLAAYDMQVVIWLIVIEVVVGLFECASILGEYVCVRLLAAPLRASSFPDAFAF